MQDCCGEDTEGVVHRKQVEVEEPQGWGERTRLADPGTLGIVQAVQQGHFDRVQSLVSEDRTLAVRADSEGITPLHWAAINDRSEVLEYLLEQGADPCSKGGTLGGTALHWAATRGATRAAVLLLGHTSSLGEESDNEGCLPVHVAGRAGQAPLMAYLAARCGVEREDEKGLTPLMWAAYRSENTLCLRLLLGLGASPSHTDSKLGNTALHWAVLGEKVANISYFIIKGEGRQLDQPNLAGQTPLQLLSSAPGLKARLPRTVRALLGKAAQRGRIPSPRVRQLVMLLTPLLVLCSLGSILSLSLGLFSKLGLLFLLSLSLNTLVLVAYDDSLATWSPPGLYLGGMACMYYTWLHHVRPLVHPLNTVSIILSSVLVLHFYLRTWRSDPGTIGASREEKIRAVVEMVETEGGLPQESFCTSCLIKRPERSKHCSVCNRCVSVFDHHCPFTGNCVGQGNHRAFLAWLLLLSPILVWCEWGLLTVLYTGDMGDLEDMGRLEAGWARASGQPWVAMMAVLVGIQVPWVAILTMCQLYQVSCLAMTTNERMNAGRYKRFHTGVPGKFRSPYDKGWWLNLQRFWRVRGPGKGELRKSLLGLHEV